MTLLRVSLVWAFALVLSGNVQAGTILFKNSTSAPSVDRQESPIARGERVIDVRFNLKSLETTDATIGTESFQQIAVDSLSLTSEVGAPALPFYAVTVAADPASIEVATDLGQGQDVQGVRAYPAQPEKCRCEADARNVPTYNAGAYRAPAGNYRIDVLGDFRGTPVSRVIVFPQQYDTATGKLVVYPQATFTIRVKGSHSDVRDLIRRAATERGAAFDYLVLSPRAFLPALQGWMGYKQSTRGMTFKVIALEDMGTTAAQVTTRVQQEYQANNFHYALIIGNQNKFPAHRVQTSTSSTPSDLPYFAMGGANDTIPDVYAGRLVVNTVQEAQRQLEKFMAYEKEETASSEGWTRALGIASNEGNNPSDNDYVLAIQSKLETKFGLDFTHFYQDDSTSNPAEFNAAMNRGALWVTYLGHGSGTSWPSFGDQYSTYDIKNMRNADQVKPFWMDVACQNGRLEPGMAGERMMNETDPSGKAIGTMAFYGGTVNISWHPPAILARGMAFALADHADVRELGAIIQAGHVYLSENFSDINEIKYNQRWYVLQGDPSLTLHLAQ